MELIKIQENDSGNQVVSARDVYQYLESKQDFSTWIKKRIVDGDFIENQDFVCLHKKMEANNATLKEYIITVDMAKHLGLMERNEKGKELRKYFIACEKKLKEVSFKVPQTFKEALLLAVEQQEKIEQLEYKQKEDEPKVIFFDQVTGSDTCFDIGVVAKICNLGVGRNTLFAFLRDNKVLQKNNLPYQQFVDKGYFRVIEGRFTRPDGSVQVTYKTVVFQKGVDFIIKKYKSFNN